MRRPIIAGNWKMFKTLAETRAFFDALIPEILGVDHCGVLRRMTEDVHPIVEGIEENAVRLSGAHIDGLDQLHRLGV